MFRIPALLALGIVLGVSLLALACSGDDDPSEQPTTVTPTTVAPTIAPTTAAAAAPTATTAAAGSGTQVNIVDFGYGPETLTARVGQALELSVRNSGQAPHTFTISGVADTGTLAAGQSRTLSFTPSSAGELQFFCTIHGAGVMSGKVNVTS